MLHAKSLSGGATRSCQWWRFSQTPSAFDELMIAHAGHKSHFGVSDLVSNSPNSPVNDQSLKFAFTALFSSTTLSTSLTQLSKMTAMKRALLIASPFEGLLGPLNDVKIMEVVFRKQGFEILKCYGADATRNGIMDAWESIIRVSRPNDIVVIYYAGHGGIVEDVANKPSIERGDGHTNQSSRYQFLVPMDFPPPGSPAADAASSFNGILDVELQDLLRRTTNRTRNVTTIFDCCHAGRMARDPSHPSAVRRNLPKVKYADVLQRVNLLRKTESFSVQLEANLNDEDNEDAVRIAAAGALETAWEDGDGDQCVGVMTRELARALREAWESTNGDNSISWQKILLRVKELVNINFPGQNPHVEGPHTRMLFSLEVSETSVIVLRRDEQNGILQAGRISGVRIGNVYTIMPLGSEYISNEAKIGEATVTEVHALAATAELSLLPGKAPLPAHGVMAFLVKESLRQLPVAHPDGPVELLNAINGSKYLCRRGVHQAPTDTNILAKFERHERILTLSDNNGRMLLSQQVSDDHPSTWARASETLVRQAEQLARANHLLSITCNEEEKLSHALAVTFGAMRDRRPDRSIATDGRGQASEGERVYMLLTNNGARTVHASVFDINVRGKISFVSSFDVGANRAYHIGGGRWRDQPQGQGQLLSWPRGISKAQPVPETLVLIITESSVDLRVLAGDTRAGGRGEPGPSALEQLVYSLATGAQRNVEPERFREPLLFDIVHIPFEVLPRGTPETSRM